MIFTTGFFDNCVVQRNRENRCEQVFEGTCENNGDVIVTVLAKKGTVPAFKNLKAGKASNGKFKGVLKGLPVSAVPCDLNFSIVGKSGRAVESTEIKNFLVGDLWLLGGQSNMQGFANMENMLGVVREVRAYYLNDVWGYAKDPIHNRWQASAPVHGGNPSTKDSPHPHKGIGPGVSFGQEMFRRTNVPQGLISCAHGGTSMSQWNPELKNLGDGSFYGAMIGRFNKLGGKIAGMIWYQGCSDTGAPESYTGKMMEFVKALRMDTDSPSLPFVMVQIGVSIGDNRSARGWNSIREQQRLLPYKIKNLLTVPAIDLELDDTIHLGSKSQHVLGRRLSGAMLSLSDKKIKKPIELGSIKVVHDDWNKDFAVIKVSFKNVSGKLVSTGRPSGFTLVDNDEAATGIFKTTVSGDMEIKLNASRTVLELKKNSLGLAYGFGLHPYCNIGDSAGRPLPAFNVKIHNGGNILQRARQQCRGYNPPRRTVAASLC